MALRVRDEEEFRAIKGILHEVCRKEGLQKNLSKEKVKLLRKELTQFAASVFAKITRHVEVEAADSEMEPLDEELVVQVAEIRTKMTEATKRLEGLRKEAPAFVEEVLKEAYEVSSAPPVIAEEEKETSTSTDGFPSVSELKRLDEVRAVVEAEIQRMEEKIPKHLREIRDMQEFIELQPKQEGGPGKMRRTRGHALARQLRQPY